MNKAQKAVQKASLNDEKRTIRELKQVYGQAKKDVEERIRQLSSRTDMENLQAIIYQKKYQEALKKQLDDVLNNLNTGQFDTISDYLNTCYENGYIGNMYDLYNQGIPMTLPMNQKKVVKALQTDTKLSSKKYKENHLKGRLAEDVDRLKVSIRAELSRSVANGSSWNEVAVKIAKGMNNPFDKAYKNALLIARTEGHRIQQSATLDAMHDAKGHGADVVKQWDSTMDRKTRPAHQEADGQIRELDEPFDVWGEKMDAPAVGGSAKNVCNCRCVLLQRAKWAMDEDELKILQDKANYFGLDKNDSFEDFKQKYLKLPENADSIKIRPNSHYAGHPDCKLAKALGSDDYENMLQSMDELCAEPTVRQMWDIFEESIDGDFNHKGGAYCSGSQIYVNVAKDAKGSDWQSPFQVICHESGHMIDYKSKKLGGKINGWRTGWGVSSAYQDGIFQKTLKEEIMDRINAIDKRMKADYKAHKDDYDWLQKNGYINSWTGQISKYSKSKAYYEFEKEIRSISRSARGDISDIVEGATKGKVKGGFGHGNSYWKDEENLALEAFAEMTDATLVNPENLEQIKKYVPKSYEIYLEIVDLIVKGS